MKKIRIIISICFVVFLAGISAAGLIAKDREFSPNENRYLAEPPKLSWENILSGEFQEGLEEYLKDHIFGRDQWITVKTAVQKAAGNTDIGGAYVGKGGYDFEKITREDVDDELVERNTKSLAGFFASAAKRVGADHVSLLLVPTSGLVMADKLPNHARLFDQSAYIDRILEAVKDYNVVDVRNEMKAHSDEYIYYKTDHHWTTDGAFIACRMWCESTGIAYTNKDALEQNVLVDNFRGSLYSKILDAGSAYDCIWTYGPIGQGLGSVSGYQVTVDEDKPGVIYDVEKLEEKDKYAFFFGGNYGQVHIEGGAARGEKKNLLVIKDSFANAFVPLILEHFDHIYMVDLRYYNGDMESYLEEHDITDVLVLYNISNFISDKNLYKLQ